jgi:predicted porin
MKTRTQLLAVAIAATGASLPLHAETEMYGLAMPFWEQVKTTGATGSVPGDRPALLPAAAYTGVNDPGRGRISVGTTQWGFRGSEQLGPDFKVVWQLESGFQIDQNTGPGLGARNSKVGLQGKFGEVLLGQWDTPYKFISLPINPFRAGYVFDYTSIMGNPGLGVPATTTQFQRIGAKPDAAFDKRVGNVIQYWSPKLGGFSARLSWSVDEGRTSPTATTVGIRPQIWSGSLMYEVGGLSLRYAYEQHDDYFGLSALGTVTGSTAPGSLTNTSSKDRAHKVVGIWRIGNTRLAGGMEELSYRNDDSGADAIREYKRRAFYVLGEQRFGNSSVWLSYGRAESGQCSRGGALVCSTTEMGADYVTLGYIYRFSKRTEVFAAYYRLNNKASGTYSPQPVVGASIAPGADTVGAGVGMLHVF